MNLPHALFSCLLALLALVLQGGAPENEAHRAAAGPDPTALKGLELWVGEWSGTGWSQFPGGTRTEFELNESVRSKVGGTVLLVEGRGTTDDARGEHVVTHDGLVLVYFDTRSRTYRWQGHDVGRDPIDVEADVHDGGLEWRLDTGDGAATLRFTLEFDAQHWREVGEISSDGQHWTRFMAMTLERREPKH